MINFELFGEETKRLLFPLQSKQEVERHWENFKQSREVYNEHD